MRVAVVGRTKALFDSMVLLDSQGFEIAGILTAREAPEYSVGMADFREWAEARRIPFSSSAKISDLRIFAETVSADLAISANYPNIIPQNIIDAFPLGILNAHGGDLPRYRGNACQAWAILNGEEKIGLCIHKMVGGEVDAGDILARDYFDLHDGTYIRDCLEWIEGTTPSLFMKVVRELEFNSGFVLERQSTAPADALRCFPRRPEDGQVDWRLPARDVQRLVRASSRPFAGAYSQIDEYVVRLWKAEVVEQPPYVAVPGQVLYVGPGNVRVACGEAPVQSNGTALDITELSIDGEFHSFIDVFRSIRQRFV